MMSENKFYLSDEFLSNYKGKQPKWGPIGYVVYRRCVTTDTKVLCFDLSWRNAGDLKVGDEIIGFDEKPINVKTRSRRYLRKGIVTANSIEKAKVMGIELEDGTIIYATPDHQWLVKLDTEDTCIRWRETKDLGSTTQNNDVFLLRPFGKPWERDYSYEAGYLSAAYDGEGCLDRISSIQFIQTENPMLKQVQQYLAKLGIGYIFRQKNSDEFNSKHPERKVCYSLRTNRRKNWFRILGTIYPVRLIKKFQENFIKITSKIRGAQIKCSSEDYVRVIRVFDAGEKDVAVLSTDIKTHFTGGFPSHNTYSRPKSDGTMEEFWQTVQRVVEGIYDTQKKHCAHMKLPWSARKANRSAERMYQLIWEFKFLPPGRGLWMMGVPYITERQTSMPLQNCSGFSTENITTDFAEPFCFMMDASMLGVGVTGDTRGAGKLTIRNPKQSDKIIVIEDSRQGWVSSLRTLLDAYAGIGELPKVFDYSQLRPKGAIIKTFGGKSSGPEPLIDCLNSINKLLNSKIGRKITSSDIVDIFNYIGKCVVSGGVRRTAQLMLGDADDQEFIELKDPDKHSEELRDRRWCSNNSIMAKVGMDYTELAKRTAMNGEPGYVWLDNIRKFSRMNGVEDNKDERCTLVNPCLTGDTLVALADGRGPISIKQLAEEDKDVLVYCKDNEGITKVSTMRHPRLTGKSAPIYEVELDSGGIVKCTGNHQFILKDGTTKKANELCPNDSLLIMSKWQTDWNEIIPKNNTSKNKKPYYMLHDGHSTKFEHTFLMENLLDRKMNPGEVIHHKDHNGLNNQLDNLANMSKEEHDKLHSIKGDKNPMRFWWNSLSKKEKDKYRQKMSKAVSGEKNGNYCGFTDDDILNEMILFIHKTEEPLTYPAWRLYSKKVGMPHMSNRWVIYGLNNSGTSTHLIKEANIKCGFPTFNNKAITREYKRFIKRKKVTDLNIFFDGCTYVKKNCEICGKEFVVKWGKREQCLCSKTCSSEHQRRKASRRHSINKVNMIEEFEKYITENNKIPLKYEFKGILKKHDLLGLHSIGLSDSYQLFLNIISKKYNCDNMNSYAIVGKKYNHDQVMKLINNGLCYNHKVKEVRLVGTADVYNGTVDTYHNFGICISNTKTKSGYPLERYIFTMQCGEMSLESGELCNLTDSFPAHHETLDEWIETLKYAYLYAKTVTLIPTHYPLTNSIMMRNRRVGCGISGIVQAFNKFGVRNVLNAMNKGYDKIQEWDKTYSDWLCIPKSIKTTTVKPSGNLSVLVGSTPGIHFPYSEYYIRNVRFHETSSMIESLRRAGYPIEQDQNNPQTLVISFPVKEKDFERSANDVTMFEKLEIVAQVQKYWADNQISVTITFNKDEAAHIKEALELYETRLKCVSFMPLEDHKYVQAPYIPITKEQYEELIKDLKPIRFNKSDNLKHEVTEKFCDGDTCQIEYNDDIAEDSNE